jgi:RNA recognition motif-containing protein
MPPRVEKKNVGTTAHEKIADKAPSKSPKTPAKPVSSTPPKAEPEAVENAEAKPSPTVETPKAEEKAVEPFQDLNEPSVEAEPEKEIPVEDANVEDKESTKDAHKPSAEGSDEGIKGIDIENKEIDTVIHEAQDNDKEHQDEPAENNVVTGEQSHGNEVAEGAGCREEGVEGDGGDDQHDVEMPAMVKERIKQKEFEVFVGGLDKDADEEDLKKVFSEVGEVVEIRLPKNPPTRKNKGFGFVRFATVEQAKKAVAELKNPQVRGKQCRVTRSRVTRSQENETLYVRNICKSWTKEALKKKLTEYGIENIEEITLREDPQQEGTNMGFAFLKFPTHLEATNAFKRLQKRDVFFGIDRCAKIAFAKSGIEPDEEVMAQVKSIFVDGLPPSWDELKVREKFKTYGEIEQVQLARNMSTERNDFGFIYFTTREAAVACIEGVNKNELNEEDNKVTLKATLRKPSQKGRSVKDGVRTGY